VAALQWQEMGVIYRSVDWSYSCSACLVLCARNSRGFVFVQVEMADLESLGWEFSAGSRLEQPTAHQHVYMSQQPTLNHLLTCNTIPMDVVFSKMGLPQRQSIDTLQRPYTHK
jgi:hypothetical protein